MKFYSLVVCSLLAHSLNVSAEQAQEQFGTVLSVKPIVEVVQQYQPVQVCQEVAVAYRDKRSDQGAQIVGGVIGAVIGSKMSRKHDKKVIGAAAGAVIGANIGKELSSKEGPQTMNTEVQCHTEHKMVEFERERGYKVVYRYLGSNYTTELPYDPGREIRLQVNFAPIIDKPNGL